MSLAKPGAASKSRGQCGMCSACNSSPPWAPERLKRLKEDERRRILADVNRRTRARREKRTRLAEEKEKLREKPDRALLGDEEEKDEDKVVEATEVDVETAKRAEALADLSPNKSAISTPGGANSPLAKAATSIQGTVSPSAAGASPSSKPEHLEVGNERDATQLPVTTPARGDDNVAEEAERTISMSPNSATSTKVVQAEPMLEATSTGDVRAAPMKDAAATGDIYPKPLPRATPHKDVEAKSKADAPIADVVTEVVSESKSKEEADAEKLLADLELSILADQSGGQNESGATSDGDHAALSLMTPELSEKMIFRDEMYTTRSASEVQRQAMPLVDMASPHRSLQSPGGLPQHAQQAETPSESVSDGSTSGRTPSMQISTRRDTHLLASKLSEPTTSTRVSTIGQTNGTPTSGPVIPQTGIVEEVYDNDVDIEMAHVDSIPLGPDCRSCEQLRARLRSADLKVQKLTRCVANRDVVISRLKTKSTSASSASESLLRQEIERLRMTCEFLFYRLEQSTEPN